MSRIPNTGFDITRYYEYIFFQEFSFSPHTIQVSISSGKSLVNAFSAQVYVSLLFFYLEIFAVEIDSTVSTYVGTLHTGTYKYDESWGQSLPDLENFRIHWF